MHFSVAANYDVDVVPELARFPVREVYGKFAADLVGGGRPSYMGTPLSRTQLAAYVAALAERGIEFNYLLNSSCLGNREWSRAWQHGLMRLLDKLGTMGIRRLTVSTPYLLEAIKKRFPAFKVRVGIFAQVDTARRARFWQDLGADAITLESFSINRDPERLREIRAAVGCELQLIANHVCLPNCALQPYHQNGFAHSSDGDGRLFLDYCILRCARLRLEDPALFVKAAWIRPEDLHTYEAWGFDSFKILERGMPSAELLRRVRAYSERRWDGNLADLILSYGFREPLRRSRFWGLRHFLKPWQASPAKLAPLLALARQQGMLFPQERRPVRIDNALIPPDFLENVAARNCATRGCRECRYCDEIARQAVTIDPDFRTESLRRFADVEDALANGSLWNA